jgi:hypothetical protein
MADFFSVGDVLAGVKECRHSDAYLARIPKGHDPDTITMWCDGCKNHVADKKGYRGKWISRAHPDLAGKDLANLPIAPVERFYRKCEGPCNKLDICDFHHLAPRKFFGDEADKWPTAWLCGRCHDRWHTIVTPGLCTTYDPVAHKNTLIAYLKPELLQQLARALVDHIKRERAA